MELTREELIASLEIPELYQGSGPAIPAQPTRNRSRTEQKLLDAAEDVFSKLGFQGATTKLIAQKSGVNESLIARYFNGKTGLLFAILRKHIETSLALSLPYAPQDTLEAELRKYVEFTAGKYKRAISTVKILVNQSLVDEAFNEKIRVLLPKTYNSQLRSRLEALQAAGKIARPEEVDRILNNLETQIFGYFLLRVVMLGEPLSAADAALDRVAIDCARTLCRIEPATT